METERARFQQTVRERPGEACRWLVETFGPRLWRAALLRAGSKDAAADLCQETFAAALERGHRFDGRSEVYTWLYGIFLNKSRERFRGSRREQEVRRDLRPIVEARLLEDDPADLAAAAETRNAVRAVIASLPEEMQELVCMRYLEGFSGEAMAAATGLSHARVRSRLSEARILLRNLLVEKGVQA